MRRSRRLWYNYGGWVEKFIVLRTARSVTTDWPQAQPAVGQGLFSMLLTYNSLGNAMYRAATVSVRRALCPAKQWFSAPAGYRRARFQFFLEALCFDFPVRILDPTCASTRRMLVCARLRAILRWSRRNNCLYAPQAGSLLVCRAGACLGGWQASRNPPVPGAEHSAIRR